MQSLFSKDNFLLQISTWINCRKAIHAVNGEFCRITLQTFTKYEDAFNRSKFAQICELIFL